MEVRQCKIKFPTAVRNKNFFRSMELGLAKLLVHVFPWKVDHLLENSGTEGLLHVLFSNSRGEADVMHH